MQTFKEV